MTVLNNNKTDGSKNNWYKSICFTDGYPGGFCSISVKCKDDNSVCSSDICQCISGYRNIEAVCREGNGFLYPPPKRSFKWGGGGLYTVFTMSVRNVLFL